MKYTNFLLIFSCMTVMFTVSCEQSDLRKSEDVSSQVVETRSIEDCEECPVEDCCCTVTVITDIPTIQDIPLVFCGTTSPVTTSLCSQFSLGNCPDIINAQAETITLRNLERRAMFCASFGQNFGLSSFPVYPGVTLAITCQNGVTPPQTVYVDLGVPGSKPYWQLTGQCILESCL